MLQDQLPAPYRYNPISLYLAFQISLFPLQRQKFSIPSSCTTPLMSTTRARQRNRQVPLLTQYPDYDKLKLDAAKGWEETKDHSYWVPSTVNNLTFFL